MEGGNSILVYLRCLEIVFGFRGWFFRVCYKLKGICLEDE